MKTQKKPKKRVPTSEEVKNDPSLRWCPYRQWETVFSDLHGMELRFVRYEGENEVRLATINGMAELSELVSTSSIRRVSVMNRKPQTAWSAVKIRTEDGEAWFAINQAFHERIRCTGQNEAEAVCHQKMMAG